MREWSDLKVHHLYSIATTSRDKKMQREALRYLDALKRAGNRDAALAVERIKGNSRREP